MSILTAREIKGLADTIDKNYVPRREHEKLIAIKDAQLAEKDLEIKVVRRQRDQYIKTAIRDREVSHGELHSIQFEIRKNEIEIESAKSEIAAIGGGK